MKTIKQIQPRILIGQDNALYEDLQSKLNFPKAVHKRYVFLVSLGFKAEKIILLPSTELIQILNTGGHPAISRRTENMSNSPLMYKISFRLLVTESDDFFQDLLPRMADSKGVQKRLNFLANLGLVVERNFGISNVTFHGTPTSQHAQDAHQSPSHSSARAPLTENGQVTQRRLPLKNKSRIDLAFLNDE